MGTNHHSTERTWLQAQPIEAFLIYSKLVFTSYDTNRKSSSGTSPWFQALFNEGWHALPFMLYVFSIVCNFVFHSWNLSLNMIHVKMSVAYLLSFSHLISEFPYNSLLRIRMELLYLIFVSSIEWTYFLFIIMNLHTFIVIWCNFVNYTAILNVWLLML